MVLYIFFNDIYYIFQYIFEFTIIEDLSSMFLPTPPIVYKCVVTIIRDISICIRTKVYGILTQKLFLCSSFSRIFNECLLKQENALLRFIT